MDSIPQSSASNAKDDDIDYAGPATGPRVFIHDHAARKRLKSEDVRNRNKSAVVDDGDSDNENGSRLQCVKSWWKFKMRGFDDDLDRDWWFASTAIPLLAATIAPMANVLSIAALVTYWRASIDDGAGDLLPELEGITYRDPRWCYWLNVASLICGFVGNVFLLFNFTGRVRYIISLPLSIMFFYIATGILIAITVSMHLYFSPEPPLQIYTQGYWYAVIAATFYFIIAMLQMVNMLGYLLGHYPQSFDLTDSQRTLILQTMLFFIWLAGGGAVFSSVEKRYGDDDDNTWSFVNSLYFCDVTILTVGFGDLFPKSDIGRGLVFPFSVGGIIFLGLVISSISKFASEISEDKVIKKHAERNRHRTVSRAISEPDEIRRIESRQDSRTAGRSKHVSISSPIKAAKLRGSRPSVYGRSDHQAAASLQRRRSSASSLPRPIHRRSTFFDATARRAKKLVILRDERDRFDAMRKIQHQTNRFKNWYALSLSTLSFGLLWSGGAVVFWQTEKAAQDMTYFQALYFCYVSLLTIGYGDLAPKSNAGRCFFVVWSLIAVPTMTILVNNLGSTVIDSFKKGTFRIADFTLLPKKGAYREWLESHPRMLHFLAQRKEKKDMKKRLREGMKYADEEGGSPLDVDNDTDTANLNPLQKMTTDKSACDHDPDRMETHESLARKLAVAIRSVASDLTADERKCYNFEEWAEITRLIRFTSHRTEEVIEEEEDHILKWDWLGENSPMMAGQSEPEFVLDRLCESLSRYMYRIERWSKRVHAGEKPAKPFIQDTEEQKEVLSTEPRAEHIHRAESSN